MSHNGEAIKKNGTKTMPALRFVSQRMLSDTKLIYHAAKSFVIWYFMRQPMEFVHGKKKPAPKRPGICTAADLSGTKFVYHAAKDIVTWYFMRQPVELHSS